MKKLLTLALALLLAIVLVACGAETSSPAGNAPAQSGTSTDQGTASDDTQTGTNTSDPTKENFTGLSLVDSTVDYDGNAHTITLNGTIPDGASVTYTGGENGQNAATNAGVYTIRVTVSKENYNDFTTTATLTINKLNFSGLSLTGSTVDYDGNVHTVALSGTVPEGASVTYAGGENGQNAATNAGIYTIRATVTKANYNDFSVTATLTINKLNLTAIEFANASFEYDAAAHSIAVTGLLPDGVTVSYTGGENGQNGATSPGTYEITATASGTNYNTLTLHATLTITSNEEPLCLAFVGNKILFENPLDDSRLYCYDGSSVTLVGNDRPKAMVGVGTKVYYIAKNLLSNSIFSYDTSSGKRESLLDVSADALATDGTYLYYTVNSLVKAENNGIFKVSIADLENQNEDATPVRLTAIKAESPVVASGKVWFSNKSDGGKLYAVSTTASDIAPTLIYDYKVSEIIADGSKLFFTRKTLTGSSIFSLNVSGLSTAVSDDDARLAKVTISNGKYLTINGDYLYFVNTDMLTTAVAGDGIYKTAKSSSGLAADVITLLSGSAKVVDGSTDNLYALAADGTYLYYFRTSNKHLYRMDGSGNETDLMAGFVPPERNEQITSYYEKTQVDGGNIYYINMKDGGSLYRYSIATGQDNRLTGLSVADFAVHDGYVYYATVRYLVNFDLYRMSLVTGEPERISTKKCMNFSFVGDKLYYTNFSGSNTLNRMNLDGTGDEIVFNGKSVNSNALTVVGNLLYFVANDQLYAYDLTTGTAALVDKDVKPLEYLIHDGQMLMMNADGLKNHVTLYNLTSKTELDIVDLGYSGVSQDARGIFFYNGYWYFYRNIAAGTSNKGLYKVSADGSTCTLVDAFEGYYICNSCLVGNKVYFMDVWQVKDSVPTPSSTGKLCVLDLSTNQITVLN